MRKKNRLWTPIECVGVGGPNPYENSVAIARFLNMS